MPAESNSLRSVHARTGGRIAKKGQKHPIARRKRDPYTTHACNRCKVAKVRCDGRLPCAYCTARDPSTCYYSAQRLQNFLGEACLREDDKNSFHASVLALLELQSQKLDLLTERISMPAATRKRSSLSRFSEPSLETAYERPLPLFHSETSSLFCVNVINSGDGKPRDLYSPTLQLATAPSPTPSSFCLIQGDIIAGEIIDIAQSDPSNPSNLTPQMHLPQRSSPLSSIHPLEDMDENQIMQTIESYGVLEGLMYPIIDITAVMQTAKRFLDARARYPNQREIESHMSKLGRNDLAILKLILATGLLTEGDIHNTTALRLFQSVQSGVESMIWSDAVDLNDLVLMTLMSLFYLHCGIWRRGWRFIGNVARIILELGLNREIVLTRSFPDPSVRIRAINTIWTVHVLERQLSYGLGVTNAAQELYLEPTFPQPVGALFLKAMVEYARIGKQATDDLLSDRRDTGHKPLHIWQEKYAFFQYQLERWTQYTSSDMAPTSLNDKTGTALYFARTILTLRANRLRTLISRAFLCTGFRTEAPLDIWTTSVDVAANTVQILASLDHSTKEYRFHQAQFNHFLVSALDTLLFATTCGSSKIGNPSANGKEIVMTDATRLKACQYSMVTLDLLRSLAETTRHSKHLWERMREVAARMNLSEYLFGPAPDLGGASGGKTDPQPHQQVEAEESVNQAGVDDLPLTVELPEDTNMDQNNSSGERQAAYLPVEDYALWDWGGDLPLSEYVLLPDTS